MEKRIEISGELLARNSLLNLVGQAVPLLIGIFVIPFIIDGLGVERFGIFALVLIVFGYFTLFDFGLGRATTKFIADALGSNNISRIAPIAWTSLWLHFFWGVFGGLLLGIITPFMTESVFNIPPTLIYEAKSSFYILAISFPIILISSSLRGILEANQRFDLINLVNIPSSSLMFLLPAIGVFLGFSLSEIVLSLVVARLLTIFAYLICCKKMLFCFVPSLNFDFKLIKPLISYGGWITVSNILGPVLNYFDRFILGSVLTMAAVTYYAVPYEVVIRLWFIPASMVMTLFPAFSSIGLDKKEELKPLYIQSLKYIILVVGPLAFALVIFASKILGFWLGSEFEQESTIIFQILSFSILFGCLAPISGALIQGLGRPDIISKLYLLYLLPNAALVWLLVNHFGIIGAALSFLFRVLIDTTITGLISCRLIRLNIASFSGMGFLRLCGHLFVFVIFLLLVSISSMPFPVQFFFILMAFFIFAFMAWLRVLDERDKKVLISIFSRTSLIGN